MKRALFQRWYLVCLAAFCLVSVGCVPMASRQQGIQDLTSLIPVQERATYEMIRASRAKGGRTAYPLTVSGWKKIVRRTMVAIAKSARARGANHQEVHLRQMTFAMRLIDTSREAQEPLARFALVFDWARRRKGGKEIIPVVMQLLQQDPYTEVRIWAFRALLQHKAPTPLLKKAVDVVLRDHSNWVRDEVLAMVRRGSTKWSVPVPEFALFALQRCVSYHETAPGGYVQTPFSGFQFPQFVPPEKLLEKLRRGCLHELTSKFAHKRKQLLPMLKTVAGDAKDPLRKKAAALVGKLSW